LAFGFWLLASSFQLLPFSCGLVGWGRRLRQGRG
jgi:hypothetical protein